MKVAAIITSILVAALLQGPPLKEAVAGAYSPTDHLPDTISAASRERIDSLQAQVERNSLGRLLSDYIFAAKLDTAQVGRDAVKSEDPYIPFVGKFIRHIELYRYNILSDTEVGTRYEELPKLVRLVDWMHIDTKVGKIAGFLLFEEGEPVDPYALSDSERLLRQTAFIQDARVILVPVEGSADSVDVRVLTRDVWSIGVNVDPRTIDRYKLKIYERNLLGYGQTIEWETAIDLERDRIADHTLFYGAPNIYGTFIDGEVKLIDALDYRYNKWAVIRGYVSPEIKWIGGAYIEGKDDTDENPEKIRKWDRQDLWLGRSFRLGSGYTEEGSRRRFVLSARGTRTDYHVRPSVYADSNRTFHDRTVLLGSASLTERAFRKMRMVFSFGRTEDIPYGFLATITGGTSLSEFFSRPYGSIAFTWAAFHGSSGYIAARAGTGSYYRDGQFEDGTVSIQLGGFSSLLPFWRSMARHFLVIDYIYGVNRLEKDDVDLDGIRGGLTGLTNTGVSGHQRLIISWEGVLFADWDWYGFRLASFAYAEAGQAGPDWNSFFFEKYYFSIGAGMRVHNERLIFDAYEVRFMYHPVVPEGAITESFKFEAVKNLNIPFLSPGAPRIIKYE
jgi:hypothetical protein